MRSERPFAANFREHPIDSSLVFDQVFISFVFVHGGFANRGIHLVLHLFYEVFNTLAISQLKAESGKGHFLGCPVHVEPHNFSRGPSVGNRPNLCSNIFLNDVTTTKNRAG
jgi:hypothetical protein